MSSPFGSLFEPSDPAKLFDEAMRKRRAEREGLAHAARTPEQRRADRRRCDDEGHPSYQVTGRKSPTQVTCPRCRCTWAIGPKTEPTS